MNTKLEIQINISGMTISNSKRENFLGIKIDNKPTFHVAVRSLCRKTSQKLNAFARIAHYLMFKQRKVFLCSNCLDISQQKIKYPYKSHS